MTDYSKTIKITEIIESLYSHTVSSVSSEWWVGDPENIMQCTHNVQTLFERPSAWIQIPMIQVQKQRQTICGLSDRESSDAHNVGMLHCLQKSEWQWHIMHCIPMQWWMIFVLNCISNTAHKELPRICLNGLQIVYEFRRTCFFYIYRLLLCLIEAKF